MFAASKSGKSSAGGGGTTDPYFPYVPLLLETTSTNGQQNNTFLDSSTNNFTITRNGTPTQGSRTPYWPAGQWSVYFSSSYLSVADSASLRFGASNFTIEAWVYRTASGATHTIACKGASTPTGWVLQISSADKLVFIDTSTSITGSTSLAANTWYYVAVVRAGTGASQTTLYVNGVSDGTGTSATTFSQTDAMRVGTDRSATNNFAGYISNLRLSNTNLTISSTPTTPLTASGSTIFLSCGYNRFVDGSSLNSAITVGTGTPTVQAFQPFSPTASYTTALYGGSGYFNGTSDYLTAGTNAALNPGTGNFTFECWIYATSTPTNLGIFQGNLNGFSIGFNPSSQLAVSQAGVAYLINDSATFTLLNQWVHIAVARSSTTLSLYKNGTRVATATNSTAFVTSTQTYIASNGTVFFSGYVANLRLINGGTTVYDPTQTTITIPTSPVGNTASTSLLLNMTNAGIYDAAAQNDVITVGDAQSSTTQYKWSPTSMKFDGTGDALNIASNPALNFGSGSFTLEAWVYLTTMSGDFFTIGSFGSGGAFFGWRTADIGYGRPGVAWDYQAASGMVVNNWYHIAYSRSGTSMRMFVNGTQVGTTQTTSQAYDLSLTYTTVGALQNANFLNGYIQDLRITKGIGRYTANFSVPSAAFPTR